MKLTLRSAISGHPHLRHGLVIVAIILVLLITLFAWNSAAAGATFQRPFLESTTGRLDY